jgi:rod shape-determining protein MreB
MDIGSAMEFEGEESVNVRGRDLVSGLPKNIEVSAGEIREAISELLL